MKKQVVWVGLTFTIAVLISSILTYRVMNRTVPVMDQWTAPVVADLDDSFIFLVFRWITELGSGSFLTPLSIVMGIVLAMYYKNFLVGFFCISGTILGYRVNHWIKLLVERERPRILEAAEGQGYSFPSGHAMVALIGYGLLVYFFSRYVQKESAKHWIRWFGAILILLIGISRYIIRVHYLSDVIAGFAYGILFLIVWIGLYHLIASLQKRMYFSN
ncbi:phosphatase PAP2 family protein [Radiobacillus kanasensis]|uniref:phosphatase PAP2 family protein n=1 Tax=Radiobacillus kanasensis TaxID=2844358 RepID=UPI001E38AAA0|nr:phosphatase PAP2 family protein [Radiobacillus kanasensis]UFU00497.1 phosphatase PAP2 family protein [Radiobacillus kanasensis]